MSVSQPSFGDLSRRQTLTGCMVLALLAGTALGNPTKSAEPVAAPEVNENQQLEQGPNTANSSKAAAIERIVLPARGPTFELEVSGLDNAIAVGHHPGAREHEQRMQSMRMKDGSPFPIRTSVVNLHAQLMVEVASRRDLVQALAESGLVAGRGWIANNTRVLEGSDDTLHSVSFKTVREALAAANKLLEHDLVFEVEIVRSNTKTSLALPTDPLVSQQYFFDNPVPSAPVPSLNQDHGLAAVYDLGFTGAGITVGIMDSDDYSYQAFSDEVADRFVTPISNHPDLIANHSQELSQLYDPFIRPDNFDHPNAVAGLVAATGNNGEGGAGVAYNATLAALINGTTQQQAEAFLWKNDQINIKTHAWAFLEGPIVHPLGAFAGTASYPTDAGFYEISTPGRAFRGSADEGQIHVVGSGNGNIYSAEYLPSFSNIVNVDENGQFGPILTTNGSDVIDDTWAGLGARTEYSSTAKWRNVLVFGAVGEDNRAAGYSTTGTNVLASTYSTGYDNTRAIDNENFVAGLFDDFGNLPRGIVTAAAIDGFASQAGGGVNIGDATADTLLDGYTSTFSFADQLLIDGLVSNGDQLGTSASAPIASGIIALMLEANPTLQIRDIKRILQETSDWTRIPGIGDELTFGVYPSFQIITGQGENFTRLGWIGGDTGGPSTLFQVNSAYTVHSDAYGFGIIDAEAAVTAAQNYSGAPPLVVLDSGVIETNLDLPAPTYVNPNPEDTLQWEVDGFAFFNSFDNNILEACVRTNIFVEDVEVILNVTGDGAGDLLIGLESPGSSNSLLAFPRISSSTVLTGNGNFAYFDYTFNTLKHWGELSGGVWRLHIADMAPNEELPVGEEVDEDGGGGPAVITFPPGSTFSPAGVAEAEHTLQDWRLRIYGTASGVAPYTLCDTNDLRCPGDWDGDGQVTPTDLLAFLDLYLAGSFLADIDGDGFVEYSDLLTFYLLWRPGRCLEDPLNPGNGRIADDPFVIGVG